MLHRTIVGRNVVNTPEKRANGKLPRSHAALLWLRVTSLVLVLASHTLAMQNALADTQSPSIVNGLSANTIGDNGDQRVRVTWNKPWDNQRVAGYNVYRNGQYFDTVQDTWYIDTAVQSDSTYRYSIVAFDDARNFSQQSAEIVANTRGNNNQSASQTAAPPAPGSNAAPSAPEGVTGRALNGNSALIEWRKPAGNITGYNVYQNGAYITTVKGTSYTTPWIEWGTDYRFHVVAIDNNVRFSPASATVTVNTSASNDSRAAQPQASNDNTNNNASNNTNDNTPHAGYRLIFSDEFRGSSIDTSKWNSRYRWGPDWIINNEKQYYVDHLNNPDFGHSPFELDGENLTINLIKTPDWLLGSARWQPYLSGMLNTYNKFRMRYGYVEMRAKLPRGRGLWPAFWLLHQHDNDRRPEIDVVEMLGQDTNVIYNTYHHYEGYNLKSTPSYEVRGTDFANDFHTYGVKWEPGLIIWYVDGVERNRYQNGNVSWEEMYLLVNLAAGGWWAGDPDGSTPLPAKMTIDYIRAYQK